MENDKLLVEHESIIRSKIGPMKFKQVAESLLDPSEYMACWKKVTRLLLNGRVLANRVTTALQHDLLEIEGISKRLKNGSMEFKTTEDFSPAEARRRIERKYGFSDVGYKGTTNSIVALKLASMVSNEDEKALAHLQKIGLAIHQIRVHLGKDGFEIPEKAGCTVKGPCDRRQHDALVKAIRGGSEITVRRTREHD